MHESGGSTAVNAFCEIVFDDSVDPKFKSVVEVAAQKSLERMLSWVRGSCSSPILLYPLYFIITILCQLQIYELC